MSDATTSNDSRRRASVASSRYRGRYASVGIDLRQRLLLPVGLVSLILVAVIALLVSNFESTYSDRQRFDTAQRIESTRSFIGNRADDLRGTVINARSSAPLIAAVQTHSTQAVHEALVQLAHRSISWVSIYESGTLLGSTNSVDSLPTQASLKSYLGRITQSAVPMMGMISSGSTVSLISGAVIPGTHAVAIAGIDITDGFLKEIARATNVNIALYAKGSLVNSSLDSSAARVPANFRQSVIDTDRDTFNDARASFVVLEDDSAALGRERTQLFLVVGAIAGAGIFTIVLALLAVRFVARSDTKLRYEATHDALTGLANRRFFNDALESAVEAYRDSTENRYAVLYIDLDHFKFINDSLGHELGDRVLIMVGERIQASTRGIDIVARLGGDEFAALLRGLHDRDDAMRILERVERELAIPIELENRTIFTSASIGITFGSAAYTNGEDLLRDADTALYRAKSQGRAQHVVFDTEMLATARRRLQIDTELRFAYDRSELLLNYQPLYNIITKQFVGWEALIRWTHPVLGNVPPSIFIPIAEETGLILSIGNWVISEACRQLADWKRQHPGLPRLPMSVNVSSQQLIQPNFDLQLAAVLQEHGLSGDELKIEITESVILDGSRLDPERIDKLRAMGIEIWIDDFGTGYSSLTYLQRYPISGIKIDRSFVCGDGPALKSPQIVSTLLSLADSLGLAVVAEGVETPLQLQSLERMRCVYGQGYGIARPLDAQDMGPILERMRLGRCDVF